MKPCPPEFTVPSYFREGRKAVDAIVALDMEWTEATPSTRDAWGTNRLLSSQLCVVWVGRHTGSSKDELEDHTPDRYDEWVNFYTARDRAPKLEDLLAHVVALCPESKTPPTVLLVCHNGLAEISHMMPSSPSIVAWCRREARLRYNQKNPVTFDPIELVAPGPRPRKFRLTVRDTMLLAPQGGKALKAIAKQNAVNNKVDLEAELTPALKALGCGISRMDLVMEHAPDLFERYALADARATLEYFLGFQRRSQELFNLDKPVMTVSGVAQAAFSAEHNVEELFACSQIQEPDEHGRMRPKAKLRPERGLSEQLAKRCYLGGLSTTYRWGWGGDADSVVLDIDMAGAYMTALASMDALAWWTGRQTRDLDEIVRAPYSFAAVKFAFPDKTKNPSLPIHVGRNATWGSRRVDGAGLIYLLAGKYMWTDPDGAVHYDELVTDVTGVELRHALSQGAQIEVEAGWVYDAEPDPVFAPWLLWIAEKRAEAKVKAEACKKAGDLEGYSLWKFADLLYKLVANGFYGKLGQGLTGKRATRVTIEELLEEVPAGPVTCPHYAATCTAIVRTALLTLVDALEGAGAKVQSATTDGCMVVVPKSWVRNLPADPKTEVNDLGEVCPKILELLRGVPIWDTMRRGRERLGQTNLLTLKQYGDRCLTARTRVNGLWFRDKPVNVAWVGFRGDLDTAAKALIDTWNGSKLGVFWTRESPGPAQVHRGTHYTMRPKSKTFCLGPDYKRIVNTDGSTTPFATYDRWAALRCWTVWGRKDRKSRPAKAMTPDQVTDAALALEVVKGSRTKDPTAGQRTLSPA